MQLQSLLNDNMTEVKMNKNKNAAQTEKLASRQHVAIAQIREVANYRRYQQRIRQYHNQSFGGQNAFN